MSVIGITGNIMFDNESIYPKAYVSDGYIASIARAKGIPFMMPICIDEEIIEGMVRSVDGVIISGGVDVHPFKYNEEPHPHIGTISKERDDLDFNVMKYALKMNKPILGICRGIQVINVYFGGTLIQDIPSERNTNIKHSQSAPSYVPTHKVNISKDSLIYNILGEKNEVNSFHHQSVGTLAKDFKVSATASDDIIEAMEYKGKEAFILGIQWHPELLSSRVVSMQNVFDMFVEICKSRK